ncbi:MAG: relaxase domain-containing protein [Lawsonella clevelandensis]
MAAEMYQAHQNAVDKTMEWVDKEVAVTRIGRAKIVTPTQGLVAAMWDHVDSRNGDPQLHTHVSILNKTFCHDGKWRALDGKEIMGLSPRRVNATT